MVKTRGFLNYKGILGRGYNNTILGGIFQYLVKLGILFNILWTIVLCNKFTDWTSCIQGRTQLISRPCNPSGIIISIILLVYLAPYFIILICIRDRVCYHFIIWYKGGIKNGLTKMDTYNIWWNYGFS